MKMDATLFVATKIRKDSAIRFSDQKYGLRLLNLMLALAFPSYIYSNKHVNIPEYQVVHLCSKHKNASHCGGMVVS